jgi:integrase
VGIEADLPPECRETKNSDLADLVEFALYTGVRQGEALGLTWDRVDRSRGVVRLEITKSGRRREVPLNAPADAVLARRAGSGKPEGLVFHTRKLGRLPKGLGGRCGGRTARRLPLPRPATHLRVLGHPAGRFSARAARFARSLLARDGPPLQSPLHLAPENLRTAVSRLDDVLKSAPSASLGTRQAQEAETLVASK